MQPFFLPSGMGIFPRALVYGKNLSIKACPVGGACPDLIRFICSSGSIFLMGLLVGGFPVPWLNNDLLLILKTIGGLQAPEFGNCSFVSTIPERPFLVCTPYCAANLESWPFFVRFRFIWIRMVVTDP